MQHDREAGWLEFALGQAFQVLRPSGGVRAVSAEPSEESVFTGFRLTSTYRCMELRGRMRDPVSGKASVAACKVEETRTKPVEGHQLRRRARTWHSAISGVPRLDVPTGTVDFTDDFELQFPGDGKSARNVLTPAQQDFRIKKGCDKRSEA
ncbi:hypothetical protein C8T65DRAFT_702302 [Cerioporus squamosus]|nr:hypothetical protein C8T65DRAFT_702302 [Cerioporus squamosus]